MNNQSNLIDAEKVFRWAELCVIPVRAEDIRRAHALGLFAPDSSPTIKPGDRCLMDETKIIDAEHRSEIWDKADNARNEEAHLRDEVFYLINALEYAYDELARIRCDYQADKQRFHDRARELSEEKERVKELEQALDKPRSHLWFELTNERVKHRSVKEGNRLLHKVYEEQSARASEYYNEMVRLSGLKGLMETIAAAPVVDSPEVELERIKKACKSLLHDLYQGEGTEE